MTPADLQLVARTRADLQDGRARRDREATGIGLNEFARTLGVSGAAVSSWELGQRIPRDVHALAYGRLLTRLARAAA